MNVRKPSLLSTVSVYEPSVRRNSCVLRRSTRPTLNSKLAASESD